MANRYATDMCAMDIETEGLSPTIHKVVSIAVASDSESVVWESRNERAMLADFAKWLDNTRRMPGIFVTWNGACFDWPFLATRAALGGVDELTGLLKLTQSPSRPYPYQPMDGFDHGVIVDAGNWDHLDAMLAYKPKSKAAGIRNGLKPVARHHGMDVIEVDRERICDLTRSELVAYNMSDVDATLRLAQMLSDDEVACWLDTAALTDANSAIA